MKNRRFKSAHVEIYAKYFLTLTRMQLPTHSCQYTIFTDNIGNAGFLITRYDKGMVV